MNKCPNCPTVPVISKSLAETVLARVPEKKRVQAKMRAMEWLVTKHPGLYTYEGIAGRAHTVAERDAIALETAAVAGLPCPFMGQRECVLGGMGPRFKLWDPSRRPPYMWLPTIVALTYAPEELKRLFAQKEIADVKIALLARDEFFLSKEMLITA